MNHQDITIMGESHMSGGGYGFVKILGNASTQEDMEAERIKVVGSGEFRSVKAGEIKVTGNARFMGALKVTSLEISGSVDTLSTVKAQSIKVYGSLTATEEVSAEKFHAKGLIKLTSLNADDILIEPAENCRVHEVGGEKVQVKPLGMFRLGFFGFNHAKRLESDTIEADRIELSNTTARIVKGNQVIIGPGCNIEIVEYQDTIEVDGNSTVKNQVKVG
jgi:cytoskeletal protein CcmA (bactofilin family)